MNRTLKTVIITAVISCVVTTTFHNLILSPYNNAVTHKVTTITNLLKNESLYDVDETILADYAASGITYGIDDKYTNYYSKEQFEHYLDNLTNGSYVIGVVVTPNENNQILVQSVIEDSAAYKAGIKSGDIILDVNSVPYNGEQLEEAVSVMRGDGIENPEGTKLELLIQRDGQKQNIVIIREVINYNSVKSNMINNDIGYLRISAFNSSSKEKDSKDTYDEFKEHLEGLKKSGMNKLILDLRNNPGGSLDVVKNIADELLPEGIITYTEDKKGNRVEYKSDEKEVNMPMVVLVNGGSASASEVLTGALKDYEKATVVGEKTFGKGIVQTVIPLNDGSGISITTSRYFTPNGTCIHDIGINPDIVVIQDENFEINHSTQADDKQLLKAVEIILDK